MVPMFTVKIDNENNEQNIITGVNTLVIVIYGCYQLCLLYRFLFIIVISHCKFIICTQTYITDKVI